MLSQAEAIQCGEIPSFPLNSFHDRNAIVQVRRFITFLRESRVDILHTHDFYTNIFGMAGGALAGVPVRIASMRETQMMRTRGQEYAQRLAFTLAHRVIGNCEAVRDRLIDQGVKHRKISVIYNGLDMNRLNPISRAQAVSLLGLPEETHHPRRYVTILANFRHEVKDHQMFLRAAQIVYQTIPESTFLLAGEGELVNQMQDLARNLGIDSRTFFLGRCDNVGELLYISDVCALSSRAEGLSNAILEYMAAARPVVATDVGGAAEAIRDGESGFLVRSGDHEAMASRIISLLRNPDRARSIGEEGRRVAKRKFSCEAQLKTTEELYLRLLQKRIKKD